MEQYHVEYSVINTRHFEVSAYTESDAVNILTKWVKEEGFDTIDESRIVRRMCPEVQCESNINVRMLSVNIDLDLKEYRDVLTRGKMSAADILHIKYAPKPELESSWILLLESESLFDYNVTASNRIMAASIMADYIGKNGPYSEVQTDKVRHHPFHDTIRVQMRILGNCGKEFDADVECDNMLGSVRWTGLKDEKENFINP